MGLPRDLPADVLRHILSFLTPCDHPALVVVRPFRRFLADTTPCRIVHPELKCMAHEADVFPNFDHYARIFAEKNADYNHVAALTMTRALNPIFHMRFASTEACKQFYRTLRHPEHYTRCCGQMGLTKNANVPGL